MIEVATVKSPPLGASKELLTVVTVTLFEAKAATKSSTLRIVVVEVESYVLPLSARLEVEELEIVISTGSIKNIPVSPLSALVEIKAPKAGVIKQIIALNSQPVEFGDHLLIFE